MGRGREEEGESGREREEREGREEGFPPPAYSHDESNFRHEETRGERRGKSTGEMEEEVSSFFHLRGRMPGCRIVGRKMWKRGHRERGRRERKMNFINSFLNILIPKNSQKDSKKIQKNINSIYIYILDESMSLKYPLKAINL